MMTLTDNDVTYAAHTNQKPMNGDKHDDTYLPAFGKMINGRRCPSPLGTSITCPNGREGGGGDMDNLC